MKEMTTILPSNYKPTANVCYPENFATDVLSYNQPKQKYSARKKYCLTNH